MSGRDTTHLTDAQPQGHSPSRHSPDRHSPDHPDQASRPDVDPADAWERVTSRMRQDIGEAAIAEAHRILRPGGRFLCLEFSQVNSAMLARAYDAWSFNVLPRLGQLVAGDADSYRYLVESIRTFPTPEVLADMFAGAPDPHERREVGPEAGLANAPSTGRSDQRGSTAPGRI